VSRCIKTQSRTRFICRPCEQTARDGKKVSNRWAVKARDVIRRHAVRLGTRWQDIKTPDDLIRIYGWDAERLAHDAEFQYANGCNYCGHPYREMGHGLADITLDVQDPDARPFYRTNTKWCCQTCNRRKGNTSPDAFEADRQIYECWSEQRACGYDPLTDDPDSLFYNGA
jgi:5-methylcytosine-specific restriction endonuclease McrA